MRLQQNPLVSKVSCYDIRGAPGVAADLSHINTPSTAVGYGAENDGLRKALEGADSEFRQHRRVLTAMSITAELMRRHPASLGSCRYPRW